MRFISRKKREPEFLTELAPARRSATGCTMREPHWAHAARATRSTTRRSPTSPRRSANRTRPKSLDEVDPEAARDLREARRAAARARAPRRRRGRRGVRQRLGGHHVQGAPGRGRRHLLLVLGRGAQPPRTSSSNTSAPSCRTPTTSSRHSIPRCSPTARSCTCRRACAARWSCRPTSASTRKNTGQFERTLIIADAGIARELPRRLHRADAR